MLPPTVFFLYLFLVVSWQTVSLASSSPRPTGQTSPMRILVLFSGAGPDQTAAIDHRLGRQIVKLAARRAQQVHPELGPIELTILDDPTNCSMLSSMPEQVANLYYTAVRGKQAFCSGKASTNQVDCEQQYNQMAVFEDQMDELGSDKLSSATDKAPFDAILGPDCESLLDQTARMAAFWQTPIYSAGIFTGNFGRKDVYTSLSRLSPSFEHLATFLVRTMGHFRWRHLAILLDDQSKANRLQLAELERAIKQLRSQVPIERRLFTLSTTSLNESSTKSDLCWPDMRDLLLQARRVARVFLLLLNDEVQLRSALLCAYQLGMNNGEYTFLASSLAFKRRSSFESASGLTASQAGINRQQSNLIDWHSDSDESNDLIAREMFESLMVFSVELPIGEQLELMAEQALMMARAEFGNLTSLELHLLTGSSAVGLHDGLILAAEQHFRWITGNHSSAVAKSRLLWGQKVPYGTLTGQVQINENGDQEFDYLLSDLEPELKVMRAVARFADVKRQAIQMLPDSYVHWPRRLGAASSQFERRQMMDNDEPPPDEPECGFTGEADKCVDRQNLFAALSLVASLLVFAGLLIGYIVFRTRQINYKLQLDDYWWKVDWNQLEFVRHVDSLASRAPSIARALNSAQSVVSGHSGSVLIRVHRPGSSAPRRTSSATGSATAATSRPQPAGSIPLIVTESDQKRGGSSLAGSGKLSTVSASKAKQISDTCFIRSEFSSVVRTSNLAMYKGELVIVKQLNANSLKVDHQLLVELHSIKEFVHENLARFVGLSLNSERKAIIYEYCSRGSLQDMLLNKSIAMDWTLKFSVLGDILDGLNFIHTTKLDYHGRLKSTNLVLDARFTVKITDFGLQSLYSQIEPIQDCDSDQEDSCTPPETSVSQRQNKQPGLQVDSLSVSGASQAYNLESVSMRDAPVTSRSSIQKSHQTTKKMRNRGAARYFWTAPEHLRASNLLLAGSKRGDVYSLAIIMFEVLGRCEPFHYGTNAKPNWTNIKTDRQAAGKQIGADSEVASSLGTRNIRRAQHRGPRRSNATVEPLKTDNGSVCSESSVMDTTVSKQVRSSVVAIEEASEQTSDHIAGSEARLPVKASTSKLTPDDILDQLRMGLKPEPVRPYLPSYILQDVDSRLVDLIRACWAEDPNSRPSLSSLRGQLRKITKGLTSRNYLDNLLERLQTYAAELERNVEMKSKDIVDEKARTEEILFRLVPRFVADRLKRNQPIVPRLFEGVTIFFSDMVGFEKYANYMSPNELVNLLNGIYCSFDSIISSFDVTKIETIIDQFLIAAGISAFLEEPYQEDQQPIEGTVEQDKQANEQDLAAKKSSKHRRALLAALNGASKSENRTPDQEIFSPKATGTDIASKNEADKNQYWKGCAEQIARMALCIRDLVKSAPFRQGLAINERHSIVASSFNIRIGIHSGKVCAGIVGLRRPKFCLIGDTVNVASRMHTNSKANRIQISASTKQLLQSVPGFSIEPRGKIEMKGKGQMDTFWLESSY